MTRAIQRVMIRQQMEADDKEEGKDEAEGGEG